MPDGGRDIRLSNALAVDGGRVLYKSFEDPQLAFTEGESGTVVMRGTGGIREERDDREVETTDEASDLSVDGTLGGWARTLARERGASEDLRDLIGEGDRRGEEDLLETMDNVVIGEAGDTA